MNIIIIIIIIGDTAIVSHLQIVIQINVKCKTQNCEPSEMGTRFLGLGLKSDSSPDLVGL